MKKIIRNALDLLKGPELFEGMVFNDLCKDVDNSDGRSQVSDVSEKAKVIAVEKGWLEAGREIYINGPTLMRHEWIDKLVQVTEFFFVDPAPENSEKIKRPFAAIYIDDITGNVTFADKVP